MNKKNIILSWLAMICSLGISAQTSIKSFEYWTDGNFAARQTVAATSGTVELDLDMSQQVKGMHYLSFRAIDSDGKVSPILIKYYIVIDELSMQKNMVGSYAYWFNSGSRFTVDIEPTKELQLIDIDIDSYGKIVPDSIAHDYVFDAEKLTASMTADVAVGLQVFTTTGVGSNAEVDSIKAMPVTIVLDAVELSRDKAVLTPSPIGGKMLTYSYTCVLGDVIHVYVEGSANADFYDAKGKRMTAVLLDDAGAKPMSNIAGRDAKTVRRYELKPTTEKFYLLMYGCKDVMETTTVTLTVAVPSGVDAVPVDDMSALPPYIYTLAGVRVSTERQDMKRLPKGVYIVNGKKILVK